MIDERQVLRGSRFEVPDYQYEQFRSHGREWQQPMPNHGDGFGNNQRHQGFYGPLAAQRGPNWEQVRGPVSDYFNQGYGNVLPDPQHPVPGLLLQPSLPHTMPVNGGYPLWQPQENFQEGLGESDPANQFLPERLDAKSSGDLGDWSPSQALPPRTFVSSISTPRMPSGHGTVPQQTGMLDAFAVDFVPSATVQTRHATPAASSETAKTSSEPTSRHGRTATQENNSASSHGTVMLNLRPWTPRR